MCHSPLITHLCFADDVIILFDGSECSLEGILAVLRNFHVVSGLALSLEKSCLFIDGGNSHHISDLAPRFGLKRGSLSVCYLGLPLLPHKMRPIDYQPVVDKVLAIISSWTVRHLSYAERLQLIQSVIFSIINLYMILGVSPPQVLPTNPREDMQCVPLERNA